MLPFTLSLALVAAAGEPLPVTSVLAVERLGQRGRSPVYTDALEARLVRGERVAPVEGDTIAATTGEERTWTAFTADDEGWFRGAPFRGGWAYATVDVPESGPWRLDASGHSFVLVDGEPRAGDVYQLGITRAPLWLAAGTHELLFRCGRGGLRATLEPAPATVYLEEKDRTLPDVLRSVDGTLLAGLLVANAGATEARGYTLVATVAGAEPTRTALPPLLPSSYRKCRVALAPPVSPEADEVTVQLALLDPDGAEIHAQSFPLRVRDPHQTHVRTFESAIDGSVQYFGVTPPPPDAAAGPLDLILTLHGAGVEGKRQARGYSPKPGAVVVAPTNRRPFGFDWEDWGRLDALEVLEQAEALYDTNPRRTYLTGHSMGGHGTWQLGVHFPDRFAAIAPSAGWRDFWHYAGTDPLDEDDPIGAILNRAANASRTLLLKENLRMSGVYVLHGDADETVPVEEARAMRTVLAEDHPNFAYHERPGAGHWWGDECMDWPPLIDFLRQNELPDPRGVLEVDFTTVDPSISHRCHWVEIVQSWKPFAPTRIRARIEPETHTVFVEVENVWRFRLDLSRLADERDGRPPVLERGRPVTVRIEGSSRTFTARPGEVLELVGDMHGSWHDLDVPGSDRPVPRGQNFKDAFRHRMVFVYGTRGTPEENAWALAKARYDHETWRYRGNGAVDVVADVDFDPAREPDRGVVLYGNAQTNAAWAATLGSTGTPFPFELRGGRVAIGTPTREGHRMDELEGDHLALLASHPRPASDVASVAVVGGTGIAGMRATDHLPYFVSGVAYPSWTVIGAEHPAVGLAAFRGAGWFAGGANAGFLGALDAWR